MKKLSIVLLLTIWGTTMFAQQNEEEFFSKPDYKLIEKSVADATSPLYYPSLMKRYVDGDSTMTLDERRHLYYGYVSQPQYTAADSSQYNNMIAQALSKQYYSADDYKQILSYADNLLLDDPFNLRAINAKLFVFAQRNNINDYRQYIERRKMIIDAIVSSGDGITQRTAFYITRAAHGYDMLPFLGYRFGGEDRIIKQTNYLSLQQNRFGIEGIYFNIKPVLDYMGKHR